MSALTPTVITLTSVSCTINKAIESFVAQLDNNQLELAAFELGRIQEMGKHVVELCNMAKDPLWQMAQLNRMKN